MWFFVKALAYFKVDSIFTSNGTTAQRLARLQDAFIDNTRAILILCVQVVMDQKFPNKVSELLLEFTIAMIFI